MQTRPRSIWLTGIGLTIARRSEGTFAAIRSDLAARTAVAGVTITAAGVRSVVSVLPGLLTPVLPSAGDQPGQGVSARTPRGAARDAGTARKLMGMHDVRVARVGPQRLWLPASRAGAALGDADLPHQMAPSRWVRASRCELFRAVGAPGDAARGQDASSLRRHLYGRNRPAGRCLPPARAAMMGRWPVDPDGGAMTDSLGPAPRSARLLDGKMCRDRPRCPDALAPDRIAARAVARHPEQGRTLHCNGVVLFDDAGALLPDGRAVSPAPACTVVAAA